MARATGVSQPHLHNILKGIRTLPPELADQLMGIAGFSLPDLIALGCQETADAGPVGNFSILPDLQTGSQVGTRSLAAFQLSTDPGMEPRFQSGDIVYYRSDVPARSELDPQAAYLVHKQGQLRVRYVRMGGQRLYLVSENSLHDPVRWDYVSLAGSHILEIVRGRIVWICRKVEGSKTSSPEETCRDDRLAS